MKKIIRLCVYTGDDMNVYLREWFLVEDGDPYFLFREPSIGPAAYESNGEVEYWVKDEDHRSIFYGDHWP